MVKVGYWNLSVCLGAMGAHFDLVDLGVTNSIQVDLQYLIAIISEDLSGEGAHVCRRTASAASCCQRRGGSTTSTPRPFFQSGWSGQDRFTLSFPFVGVKNNWQRILWSVSSSTITSSYATTVVPSTSSAASSLST